MKEFKIGDYVYMTQGGPYTGKKCKVIYVYDETYSHYQPRYARLIEKEGKRYLIEILDENRDNWFKNGYDKRKHHECSGNKLKLWVED